MIDIEKFTKFVLTQNGFELDKQGELRHFGFLFWNMPKEIIIKKLNEYKNL